MKIDELTEEQLAALPVDELVELMLSSLLKVKPLQVEYLDLTELAAMMYEANFSLVRKKIKYKDMGSYFLMEIPTIDERKNVNTMFAINVDKLLPPNNYYIYVGAKVTQLPFGLVEVTHIGQHIKRNDNDSKFERLDMQYSEPEFLYYDQEKDTYIQVNSTDLKKARWNLSVGESVEKESVEIQTYLHREHLFDVAGGLVKKTGTAFQRELIDMYQNRKKEGSTIKEIIAYITKYSAFVNKIDIGLKIYLVYSNLTITEYEKLREEKEKISNSLKQTAEKLQELLTVMKNSRRYGKEENEIMNLGLGGLYGDTEEKRIYTALVDEELKHLRDFLTPAQKQLNMDGYIGYDLEKWELYPNILEMDKRRWLTEESTNARKEKEFQDKILRKLSSEK